MRPPVPSVQFRQAATMRPAAPLDFDDVAQRGTNIQAHCRSGALCRAPLSGVLFHTHFREEITVTNKQKRFCDEYLIDCNGTRAYKAAYPSIKTQHAAEAAANRLLSNVDVQKCIAAGLISIHAPAQGATLQIKYLHFTSPE